MAEHSAIPWCDASWPITAGCSEASEGCRFCWARQEAWRKAHNQVLQDRGAYEDVVEKDADGRLRWTGAVSCIDGRLDWPVHWRKPRRIFVCSESDLFHPAVPFGFIDDVWERMRSCSQHTFLVLTKRPERLLEWYMEATGAGPGDVDWMWSENHLPNVWLGVTCESQQRADERIPILMQVPAAVRWVSLEPLLGPVDLSRWLPVRVRAYGPPGWEDMRLHGWRTAGIHWVVVAGGSGGLPERQLVQECGCRQGARISECVHCGGLGWRPKPEALQWVRQIRDQCQTAGVPFFFKGWGGRHPTSGGHAIDGQEWREFP